MVDYYSDADESSGLRDVSRRRLTAERIPTPFNIFMGVEIEPASGAISICEPRSQAGSSITFQAQMSLLVAVSACSAENANAGQLGPIDIQIANC